MCEMKCTNMRTERDGWHWNERDRGQSKERDRWRKGEGHARAFSLSFHGSVWEICWL